MSDAIREQQQAMWDAYSAREYEKALAIAVALGPDQDQGLRTLLESHVEAERVRAAAQRDVDTLPESDVRHLVSRARLLLLDVPVDGSAGPSTDPRLAEALGHLELALAKEPENADAVSLRWSAHLQRGEKDASLATGRRMSALRPTANNLLRLAQETPDRFERFTLILAASKIGGDPAAVFDALDALLVDPPDEMSEVALDEMRELSEIHEHAALLWGRRLRDAGEPEAAVAVWRGCFPSDPRIRMDLEDLLRELGRDDEADALLAEDP